MLKNRENRSIINKSQRVMLQEGRYNTMNNFEAIFGSLMRRNERADFFCREIGIDSYFEKLWNDPEVGEAVKQACSNIKKRLGRLLEFLPESSILEIMRIRRAIKEIDEGFLRQLAEIRINNFVAGIYGSAAEIIEEEAYLNVIRFALRGGLKEPSDHVKKVVIEKFGKASDVMEDCVIHYVVFPYLDWKNPKRMPQDLIDAMRKLRIEGYRAAEKVIQQYEVGQILSRK